MSLEERLSAGRPWVVCAKGLALLLNRTLHVPSGESQDATAFDAEQSVFYGSVCLVIIKRYGHYSRISAQSERNCSAVQIAWRRKRTSNFRYSLSACERANQVNQRDDGIAPPPSYLPIRAMRDDFRMVRWKPG